MTINSSNPFVQEILGAGSSPSFMAMITVPPDTFLPSDNTTVMLIVDPGNYLFIFYASNSSFL
jgi:hypothetical protein